MLAQMIEPLVSIRQVLVEYMILADNELDCSGALDMPGGLIV